MQHSIIGMWLQHGLIQRGAGGPDPLKNHKATKPAFNVWPLHARQRNANSMAFRWRVDEGPIKAVYGSSIPHPNELFEKTINPFLLEFWLLRQIWEGNVKSLTLSIMMAKGITIF